MQPKKPKVPKTGGAKKAAAIFKKSKNRAPSDELIEIISEIPEDDTESSPIRERVAKDLEI